MTAKIPPTRHWRSYGNETLPTGAEARDEPFAAFPSWFLHIECDRCGKVQMVNEAHARWRPRTLRDILARMRHDGCGGLAAKAELLTGIEGASSRPVRVEQQHHRAASRTPSTVVAAGPRAGPLGSDGRCSGCFSRLRPRLIVPIGCEPR